MQEPTHILAGVIIQKSFEWRKHRAVAFGLVAVLAFLSHGLLDKIADVTYHPANADFHDPFWVSYHLCILLATIAFLCIWWRRFKWGIFFAMLPDADWIFIHGQEIFHLQLSWYRQPHLHHFLHWLYAQVPALSFLDHLPNHRHNPWACLWEVLLIGAMLLVIRLQTKKKSSDESRPRESQAEN
jgi:hypothetical protein